MSTGARLGQLERGVGSRNGAASNSRTGDSRPYDREQAKDKEEANERPRVFIAAENRLLIDALAKMLRKRGGFEVEGLERAQQETERTSALAGNGKLPTLLITSRGSLEKDLEVIRRVRASAPNTKILVLGLSGDEMEFLRYVRSGIDGCLLRDAAAEDVLEAVKALHGGESVCPGVLCSLLFRYFERETSSFPSVSMNRELGLTRREQQLIPLIAKGMTNKEIASHFCLSEQTVKNHLYRMKHKVGAPDRLGIVKLCQEQGFFI